MNGRCLRYNYFKDWFPGKTCRYFPVIMYNKTRICLSLCLSFLLLLTSSILRNSSFPLRNQLPGQICWNAIASFPTVRIRLFSWLMWDCNNADWACSRFGHVTKLPRHSVICCFHGDTPSRCLKDSARTNMAVDAIFISWSSWSGLRQPWTGS